jgi:hypothetical protein
MVNGMFPSGCLSLLGERGHPHKSFQKNEEWQGFKEPENGF